MITLFALLLLQTVQSIDKYSHCIKLLGQKIPINKKDQNTREIMKKYSKYFDNRPPTYKEKEKICLNNKKLFENVAKFILEQINLEDQITEKQMARCISRSISLFAYTIDTMRNSRFSNDVEKIKKSFLSSKSNQKIAGHHYVIPQINKNSRIFSDFFLFPDENDLSKEENLEDSFLSEFSSESFD